MTISRLLLLIALGVALLIPAYVSFATYEICTAGPDNHRLREASAMVERRELLGLNRIELSLLIGEPGAGITNLGWDESYFIRRTNLCLDSEWLVVRFDNNGRVEDADVILR